MIFSQQAPLFASLTQSAPPPAALAGQPVGPGLPQIQRPPEDDAEGQLWDGRIHDAIKRWEKERDRRERYVRIYQDGRFKQSDRGESEEGVNVNLCFSYVAGLTAFLMGNTPTLEIEPRRGLGDEAVAETLQKWLEYSYVEASSQDDAEVCVFDAILRGMAWLKEGFEPRRGTDVADALTPLEVYVDPIARYKMQQARYVIQKVIKPIDEARLFFNRQDIEPNYMLAEAEGLEGARHKETSASQRGKDLLLFYEIWCRKADGSRKLYYRQKEGSTGPTAATWLDQRDWPFVLDHDEFPYSPLIFNTTYMGVDGFSEMAVVEGLQREVQEMFEFDRRHGRKGAAVKLIIDESMIPPEEETKLKSAKDYEIVRAKLGGRSAADAAYVLDVRTDSGDSQARYERAKGMHDEILRINEMMRGAGSQNSKKTATEADIQDEWAKMDIGKRQRSIDKWQTSSLRHRAQIARMLVDPETVAKAVGPEAAQAWAGLSADAEDLVREYSIAIQAGSTGERYRARRVQEAQASLDLYAQVNDRQMAAGQPPAFDVVEAALALEKAKGSKNPERFLLPPPPPPPQIDPMTGQPVAPGLEQMGQPPAPEGLAGLGF